MLAHVGQDQVTQQCATVGDRIGAHAAFSRRRQFTQGRVQPAVRIEQFVGRVTVHPLSEHGEMAWPVHFGDGQPVGKKSPLDRFAVHHLRPAPAFG